jgi:type VI secretion system protein ImpF
MARSDQPIGIQPSIIDRLIDPDAAGTAWRRGYGVEQMVQTVQRDLEDLLNTRQTHVGLPLEFTELHRSVFGYGLPDLISLDATTPQQRQAIGRELEAVIARFEPRLKDVHAVLLDENEAVLRTVRFRVEARLSLEPAPEVAFDTILELTTGHYTIKPSEFRP